jgi:hypothetical protein
MHLEFASQGSFTAAIAVFKGNRTHRHTHLADNPYDTTATSQKTPQLNKCADTLRFSWSSNIPHNSVTYHYHSAMVLSDAAIVGISIGGFSGFSSLSSLARVCNFISCVS